MSSSVKTQRLHPLLIYSLWTGQSQLCCNVEHGPAASECFVGGTIRFLNFQAQSVCLCE